ncbi:GYF domain-containing protein [Cryptosporidium felis]|nr:GYF domain-containing protein [Cryptosporidium felis]
MTEKTNYKIELSISIGSIKVAVKDEASRNCRYFSFIIDIEPTFNSVINSRQITGFKPEQINETDSDSDNDEKTQFRSEWYKVHDELTRSTFEIFSNENNGNIKECLINKKITLDFRLPRWIPKMAKEFYEFSDRSKDFEQFLISTLQIRITILAKNNECVDTFEILEIGETVIGLSENQILSKHSFFFIHCIPDHDALVINEGTLYEDEHTIGIIRCFFNYVPIINKSSHEGLICNELKKEQIYDEKSSSNESIPLQLDEINNNFHEFVPLQWEYLDDENIIRGPFNSVVMMSWIIKGYFGKNSKLRLLNLSENNYLSNYVNFEYLPQYLPLIKSDILRMFLVSKGSSHPRTVLPSDSSDNLLEIPRFYSGGENNPKIKNNSQLIKKDSLFSKPRNKIEIEDAINLLKTQFSRIDKEFKERLSNKSKDKETDKQDFDDLKLVKGELIKYTTRNMFRRENNFLFKKWCAEYGTDLVLEACAIRIQTTYRKYMAKKKSAIIN